MGLIRSDDIKGVKWVLEGILNPKYIEENVMEDHLRNHFQDVIILMEMLKIGVSQTSSQHLSSDV